MKSSTDEDDSAAGALRTRFHLGRIRISMKWDNNDIERYNIIIRDETYGS